jgi:hypothetical protein
MHSSLDEHLYEINYKVDKNSFVFYLIIDLFLISFLF